MAFDVGERHVGVALGNTVSRQARALEVIGRSTNAALFARLAVLIRQWQPQALVVGRPLTADGAVQPATAMADRFARRLEGRYGLPVHRVDERYSSVAAQSWRREHGRGQGGAQRRRQAWHTDDALAAAIILQQYLDSNDVP